jgi:hypothetical protein
LVGYFDCRKDKGKDGEEPSLQDLFESIRDLSAHSFIMYAKSHFYLEKGGVFKKADTVEEKIRYQTEPLKHSLHARFSSKQLHEESIKVSEVNLQTPFEGSLVVHSPDAIRVTVVFSHSALHW